MRRPGLLSDQLDRVAYSTFFLGAVVPLVALAVTLDRFVLPGLADRSALGWILGAISIGVLSLGSFFALRHMTRRVVAKMKRDNLRLAALLRVSGELADAQHLAHATETVARCALELTDAEAAFVFADSEGNPAALTATSGERAAKLYESQREDLDEIARLVRESGRPVVRGDGSDPQTLHALAVPIPAPAGPVGALVVTAAAGAQPLGENDALATLAGLAAVAIHNADLRDAQRNFFSHVTDILVQALDAHLQFHIGHGQRVAELANRMGRALKLSDVELHRLHFAALLHDIGMLKLDRNQQMNSRTCDKHALIGGRMLARIRLWKDLAPIVQHHHEWWDGHGYPDGLAGESIPREARIIAICDAFDTMTSEHSYKGDMPIEEAFAELDAFAGTQFDPSLVRVLQSVVSPREPEQA